MRPILMSGLAALALVASTGAQAQAFLPFGGFSSLPSFAWPKASGAEDLSWEGSFARLSSGFQVTSSKRFGTHAGPTIGFEGGKLWRDGDFVFGVVGSADYMAPFGGYGTPRFGGIAYTRDFAGALQVKAGAFVSDDVLVFTKVGAVAINETLRFGATVATTAFDRSQIAVRPDARVGVEWKVTDKLTIGLEAGVTGSAIR